MDPGQISFEVGLYLVTRSVSEPFCGYLRVLIAAHGRYG